MKKRLFGMVVLAALLALALPQGALTAAKKTELTVWMGSWWAEKAPLVVEEFEKAFPQYDLKIDLLPISGYFDKAAAAIISGDPPDVLALDIIVISSFAAKNLIMDLTESVGKKLNAADFVPSSWNPSHYKGRMYGMPYRSCGSVLFYNKKMFDDAGVPYPQKGWTFDDLVEKAKKITVPGQKWGFGIAVDMSDMGNVMCSVCPPIWGFGGDFLNEDYTKCTLDQPNAIKGITWLTEIYTKHKIVPEGSISMTMSRDGLPLFANNKLAVLPFSENAITFLSQYPDLKWDVVEWPNGGFGRSGGWSFTIPVTAKHKTEAIDFLLWFAKPEVQAKVNAVAPANIHAWDMAPPWNTPMYKRWFQASLNGRTMPTIGNWSECQKIIVEEWQKALLQEKTPEQAAKDMTRRIDKLLKQS